MNPSFTLWLLDLKKGSPLPVDDGAKVAHWNRFVVNDDEVSVVSLMEAQSPELRQEYLAWLHELANADIGNKTLQSKLLSRFEDFSFWSCSTINESSPLRTNGPYLAFKLRTLEKYYLATGFKNLVYRGSDPILDHLLKNWMADIGHNYRREKDPTGGRRFFRWRRSIRVPHTVRGVGNFFIKWLQRYLQVCWYGRQAAPEHRRENEVTIVTYFPNFDQTYAKKGEFRSHYWQDLHPVFRAKGRKVNWVWIYANFDRAGFSEALALRSKFPLSAKQRERFFVAEDFLTLGVLARAFWAYLHIWRSGWMVKSLKKRFQHPDSSLNFFSLFENDWKKSLFGSWAMDNAIWSELFDAMARKLPADPWALYVWENQAWEYPLVAAWRRHGVRRILGSQHSAIRPLDLRSFSDPRNLSAPQAKYRPIPDELVVNGEGSRSTLLNIGPPNGQLTLAEAVRYLHLKTDQEKKSLPTPPKKWTLILLTSYLEKESRFQLSLLKESLRYGSLENYDRFIVKAHPYLCVRLPLAEIFPKMVFEYTDRPLGEILTRVDVAYCANSTAAMLEAAWMGIPVVSAPMEDGFNQNPLFEPNSSLFVRDAKKLGEFLRSPRVYPLNSSFFELNADLPRWRRLLDDVPTSEAAKPK